MLNRFDRLQNIGRFVLLQHQAPSFEKMSLVYARNGYGKSTIGAVLRSVVEGNADHISARRNLGASGDPRAQITWQTSTLAFQGGKWNNTATKTYIFDQEYVQQNVYVGDSVTRENKRRLLPIILGKDGVQLAQEVYRLDLEQKELAAMQKELGSKIKGYHPSISDVNNYCSEPTPSDLDEQIASSEREVELARQTVAVRDKPAPRVIEHVEFEELDRIAKTTIESVSSDIVQKIHDQISRHHLGPQGNDWLQFGSEHLHGDDCPFCNQSLKGIEVVEAYGTYFSDDFANLVSELNEIAASMKKLWEEEDARWQRKYDSDAADFNFWQSVTDLKARPTLDPMQRNQIDEGLRQIAQLLDEKIANPLKKVDINSDSIRKAFDLLKEYNSGVDDCAKAIDEVKRAAQSSDLAKVQLYHDRMLALKARDVEPVASLASDYLQGENRRKKLATEKEAAKSALKEYAPKAIADQQVQINTLLSDFGADFTVVDANANFVGREPNTDFSIAVSGGKVKAGEMSATEPSFKTVLSSGDKTTLALALFISQVCADPDIDQAVVVFDDPFNSQDMGRQFETTSQIRVLASQAAQIIVLSHDPRFLHMIMKDASQSLIELQIQCSDNGEGVISSWSSANEIKEQYVRQAEIIREYGKRGQLLTDVSEVEVLRSIRPFLEDYINARFPGRFGAETALNSMANDINSVGPTDPMFSHLADLRALNEFTRANMHGGGEHIDPAALKAQCGKVLRIIGSY